MSSTLNLFDFLEKILSEENHNLEYKVYILQQFSSRIRKEFFKNNFMPFLKDLMSLLSDIDKILSTNIIQIHNSNPRIIDVSDITTTEVLETSKIILKELIIEGSKRWNILLDSTEFVPTSNNGTLRISMPSTSVGLYLSFEVVNQKKIFLFKDIGIDAMNEWTWSINWEYDIPKETVKHILKEKITSLI
jgi:hypothetical protein